MPLLSPFVGAAGSAARGILGKITERLAMTDFLADYAWLPQGWCENTRLRIEAGALTEVDESANGGDANRKSVV